MAPEGHASAAAAIASLDAASGLIHGPLALGTNTSGCPSTQLREWMHFPPSKRTTISLPRYSSVLCAIRVSSRSGPLLNLNELTPPLPAAACARAGLCVAR